jgi:lipid-A-disaccharide synthase
MDTSTNNPRRIFVIAGEASGDLHASNLIRALRDRAPDLEFEGFGGPKMEAAGVRLHRNIVEDLAIIGLVGVLKNFPELRRLFADIDRRFDEDPPDAVLLVDYPGFNIRVARKAKARDIPAIYYICPQTWAWHESRAKEFPEILDKMLTIFPFEETMFREYGADATFVGHPQPELMKTTESKEEACARIGIDPSRPLISLLPGSRKTEVKGLLPVMLDAAERIVGAVPEAQFVLSLADTIPRSMVDGLLENFAVDVTVDASPGYNLRAVADFAWVASGTATLETAFLSIPMIIIYKTSWLTWVIGKRIAKLPYVGLPNVVAGERIVPELLQDEATGQNLADRTLQILMNPSQMQETRYLLSRVRRRVEFPKNEKSSEQATGAYDRAAREALKALDRLVPPRK